MTWLTNQLIVASLCWSISYEESSLGWHQVDRTRTAWGALGITHAVCRDVNRRHGTRFTPAMCVRDYELSKDIAVAWWAMKGARTPHEAAAMWRKGKRGQYRPTAQRYAYRVTRRMRA